MKFGAVAVDEAEGTVLAHKLLDGQGRRLFNKGHVLTADDLQVLRDAGLQQVIVARLEANDLDENTAADRVAAAICGQGMRIRAGGVGRANLLADAYGPLRLNATALELINNIDESITIASLREHTLVRPGELVALVKIIPFGVGEAVVLGLEHKARELGPVVSVRAIRSVDVALIVAGPDSARDRLMGDFVGPVRDRIERLGSRLLEPTYVSYDSTSISGAIRAAGNVGLILTAGISAIIDRDDVVPTAVGQAGGHVVHFGVPVDPGSLLMLGYVGDVPVIGAPGCVKSPKTNVIDMLLPRLLAGERLTRADLVALGHGGLLEDISERPMPRNA